MVLAGSGNYLPFLRLTTKFRIPWVIFSDGDSDAIENVNRVMAEVGESASEDNPRCFVIPDGKDFEAYLVSPNSLQAIRQMIAEFAIERAGTTNERAIEALRKKCLEKTEAEVLAELRKYKTAYGARAAQTFKMFPTEEEQVPGLLRRALETALRGRNIEEDE